MYGPNGPTLILYYVTGKGMRENLVLARISATFIETPIPAKRFPVYADDHACGLIVPVSLFMAPACTDVDMILQ